MTPTATAPTPTSAAALERFIDACGLRHFRGAELTPLWRQTRQGVQNTVPPASLWGNIVPTLLLLDHFRAAHGAAVVITSAYRSPAYNAALGEGASPHSQHLQFRALDFYSPKGAPREWAAWFRRQRGKPFTNPSTGQPFELRGGIGVYGSFVHVDTRGVDADW